MEAEDMKVIGTDKNGDEIAEVSVTELDTMFKEIRAKAIDEFVDRLEKYEQENWVNHLEYGINWSDIEHIVQEMKAGGMDEN